MSDVVRMKLLEADHPIGIKKKCPYPLPPLDHVYGLPYKKSQIQNSTLFLRQ